MIKKNVIISLFVFALGISSCGGTTLEETPDGYLDVLPNTSESAIILHAFDWSFSQIEDNIPAIAEAGYKIVQTSPVQQPKSGGASWWSLYQPISFSIATSSPLGTKEDLESLCETAESYGVDIICDIVFNHMANINEDSLESDGTPKVSPDVAVYEPYIYEHRNDVGTSATFHHNPNATGSGAVTQVYSYGKLPDLNTANPYVQERSLNLLKECIDVGVDGFRFDAAKHIETPDDPQYSSDFWPNVLGEAEDYYFAQTGKDLFAYGEILNDPDGNRSIDLYTPHMKVTDNSYISLVASGSSKKDAVTVLSATYGKNTTPDNLIAWVESHDTYIDATSHSGELRTAQRWAVMASRKDLSPLFFARPNDNLEVGTMGSYHFENETIATINRFHNRFIGYEESLSADGSVFVNERYDETNTGGAVVVDFAGVGSKTVELSNLKNGIYYNQMTGEQIAVKGGKAKITFDATGIVVLTMSKHLPRPVITISSRGESFVDSLALDIESANASEASYKINDGEFVTFTNSTSITIGDVVDANNQIILTISAQNEEFSITKTYTYSKITLVDETKFNVVNLNSVYYNDYELYYWAWPASGTSSWSQDYTIVSGVLLIDFSSTNYIKFLLAIFPKDYQISNIHSWDSNAIKQSVDISITDKFYNASNF